MRSRYRAGIDVGGTFTKMGLLDQKGRLAAKSAIPSRGFSDKKFFATRIQDELLRLARSRGISWSQVEGIGIGLPGPVDTRRGVVLSLTNIRKWEKFPLRSYLSRVWHKPVFLENDANCMALAEARLGAARGAAVALCVTLGTGVGGGLILDGKIYQSPFFLGGEVGHMPVAPDGPACPCGGVGCLERFVGNDAILRRARRLLGSSVTLEKASLLARQKNPRAARLWQGVGQTIGIALAGIVNVINPQVIVVGGGVSNAGRVLLDSIASAIRRHAMKQIKSRVRLKKALLGHDAGLIGAALLVNAQVL